MYLQLNSYTQNRTKATYCNVQSIVALCRAARVAGPAHTSSTYIIMLISRRTLPTNP